MNADRPTMFRRETAATILVALASAVALAACAGSPAPAGPDQPGTPATANQSSESVAQAWPPSKVAADTYVTAGLVDPASLDPAQVYETTGSGLDMSFYDGLVAFQREQPDAFVPALATEWAVSDDGLTYTFKVREGVQFHAGGTLEPHDAAYSIQRVMLRDASNGPAWMFLQPILSVRSIQELVQAEAKLDLAAGAPTPAMADLPEDAKLAACQAAQAAVAADDATGMVTIRLKTPTPWFPQLLATWIGSVLDQEWMAEQGDWDGSCATWTKWHDQAIEDSVLYERENGTGPFKLASWKKKESVTLAANEDYWRTEPAWEGGPAGPPRLKHVVLKHVAEWGSRYAMLQSGEVDAIAVPGTEIDQMEPLVALEYQSADDTTASTAVHPDGILKLCRGFPTVNGGAINMAFGVATEGGNEFIGSGNLDGEGIPPDFFSDIHVRRAFNYCFDWDTYIRDVIHGDGVQMRGPIIQGLQGYRDDSPIYGLDLARCEEELAQAWGGRLPETGFRIVAPYAEGWTDAQAAFDLLADGLAQVNPKYRLQTVQMEWPAMLDNIDRQRLPLSMVGWIEDYHDASNWAQAYMASKGSLSGGASWPAEIKARIDPLVEQGVMETDPAKRDAIYAELQQIAHDEALAIYMYQGLGRNYLRRELNGWYDNVLSPGGEMYALWKGTP